MGNAADENAFPTVCPISPPSSSWSARAIPRRIHDWKDLVEKPGIEIITEPKTSGNGKLTFLAALGRRALQQGTKSKRGDFVAETLQARAGAGFGRPRARTTDVRQNKKGDVHLTWEKRPSWKSRSRRASWKSCTRRPASGRSLNVAVVDEVVDHRKSRETAEAYLKSVYEPEAQENHRQTRLSGRSTPTSWPSKRTRCPM